jgi:hypothetical protein
MVTVRVTTLKMTQPQRKIGEGVGGTSNNRGAKEDTRCHLLDFYGVKC